MKDPLSVLLQEKNKETFFQNEKMHLIDLKAHKANTSCKSCEC